VLFNSFAFLVFLPTVFGLYWYAVGQNLRLQNLLVLIASYVFYGWWDWRFLGLLAFSTVFDYLVGQGLVYANREAIRKLLFLASLAVNLSLLGFFKYWNFFVDSWIAAWSQIGVTMHPLTAQIILPVGISFYTFQTLSYTIDVYRRRFVPVRDPIAFAAFVAFFPQLVAGPIERAAHLLPQFMRHREFNYSEAAEGVRQMIWGFFKKIVIADQLAVHVDGIFADVGNQSGATLALGAVFFAFQIYCDFSGYSDIAIGIARLFGFSLVANFRYPYFARDIAEFWRRWHMSLTTWFRDYLYIPLGGSRGSVAMTLRNVSLVFLLSGLWHGANWTFIIWGALHALYFMPLVVRGKNRRYLDDAAVGSSWPSAVEFVAMLATFSVTCVAWVFFRAPTVSDALAYLQRMVAPGSFFAAPVSVYLPSIAMLTAFVIFEWIHRTLSFPLARPGWPAPVRYLAYFGLIYWMMLVSKDGAEFIYFQF
jgi:alginate O-acetyltransferase complex protein AlgI